MAPTKKEILFRNPNDAYKLTRTDATVTDDRALLNKVWIKPSALVKTKSNTYQLAARVSQSKGQPFALHCGSDLSEAHRCGTHNG